MFQPASLKGGSSTPVDERLRYKYFPFYLLVIFLSVIPIVLFEYFYITFFWKEPFYIIFFILIAFNIVITLYLLQFSALLISSLLIIIVKLIHNPNIGVFKRNLNNKEYKYWNLRNMIKKWPLFIVATNPFPWLKNRVALRFFGTKIGRNCLCDNSWISSEFVEIGKNVIIGMGSTILSFGIEQEKLILKKIRIADNVIIGAKCVILPGTKIHEGAKLNSHSYTLYDQELKKYQIYSGHPAELKKIGNEGQ
ncbi:MAG: hypothetical protein GF317_23015 [Candidatus Lokiarchaeota archaeon]|nr:hypothetical protein [Candidatus Lokiarchaeota archaeon]MBD3202315.1 hypothetical protein [Candidatus Lokiarchaeota archaeon]